MEEKKKNNKGLVIIIILLVIIVLGLIGYICYDKGIILSKSNEEKANVEEKNESNDNSNNIENLELNDEKFYSLYNTLKKFTYETSRGLGSDDFNNQELALLGFGNANITDDDITTLSENNETGVINVIIKLDKVDDALQNIFGKKVDVDYSKVKEISLYTAKVVYKLTGSIPDKYGCGFNINSYDKENNSINVNIIDGCGGTSGPSLKITERKIIEAEKKGDVITVVEKAIYYNTYNYNHNNKYQFSYQFYRDNSKISFIENFNYSEDEIENHEVSVDNYLDIASTITHTFKLNKDTNKYYFVSSTIK